MITATVYVIFLNDLLVTIVFPTTGAWIGSQARAAGSLRVNSSTALTLDAAAICAVMTRIGQYRFVSVSASKVAPTAVMVGETSTKQDPASAGICLWRSLVARPAGGRKDAGSNPVRQTVM